MNDRRRINGPSGTTHHPVYATALAPPTALARPRRTRESNELRKIFLQTGLTPSASGSAYLELQHPDSVSTSDSKASLLNLPTSPKVTVTVHGPRPLPRSSPFSPTLILSTYVRFAPFATRRPRGYVRDNSERDLSAHLESALRGVIIGDRWPKSGVDVYVTVLEGEESTWWGDGGGGLDEGLVGGWGMMTILAACITASSAAIVEAGIDCVDLVTGGVAALVPSFKRKSGEVAAEEASQIILDPSPMEHRHISAACVVGYLASRDELVEVWLRGDLSAADTERIIDSAVESAAGPRHVLEAVLKENIEATMSDAANETIAESAEEAEPRWKGKATTKDLLMTG